MDTGSSRPSGWLAVTAAVLAIVWCVNADTIQMSCEVCGSDGEVERVFATERFEACNSTTTSPLPHTRRLCPPNNHACVTRILDNGSGKIVSKSCAERAVSGCHKINNEKYCYCTTPNCNTNTNLPSTTTTHQPPVTDDEEEDQEGSADGARLTTRQPSPILTLVPPKFKASAAISVHQVITGSVLWMCVGLRTAFS